MKRGIYLGEGIYYIIYGTGGRLGKKVKKKKKKTLSLPSFFANLTPLSMDPGLSSKSSLAEANVSANANSSSCSMLVKPGSGFFVSWYDSKRA